MISLYTVSKGRILRILTSCLWQWVYVTRYFKYENVINKVEVKYRVNRTIGKQININHVKYSCSIALVYAIGIYDE